MILKSEASRLGVGAVPGAQHQADSRTSAQPSVAFIESQIWCRELQGRAVGNQGTIGIPSLEISAMLSCGGLRQFPTPWLKETLSTSVDWPIRSHSIFLFRVFRRSRLNSAEYIYIGHFSLLLSSTLFTDIVPNPNRHPHLSLFSIIFNIATIVTMYSVRPDDMLLVRHPEPSTGSSRTVCHCSCHNHPSKRDDDDNSVITYSSYSTCPHRTNYDFTLSEILPPPKDFVHPCEYSSLRSPDRSSGLRRLLAIFGRRRRASKPMGEGTWLRAALYR